MIREMGTSKPTAGMSASLALVFLVNLSLLPEVTLAADSCYSCMTCTASTSTQFAAALALVGTTDGINTYAEAPTFPTTATNCPLDGENVQKATMAIPGTNCISGYWVYKATDGSVVQSCAMAIPVEELFKTAPADGTTEPTTATLKTETAKLTAAGLKADLTGLTTAEDSKGTASISAMFTICTTDDCNTPKSNEMFESTQDAGAYDAAKVANKEAMITAICDSIVTATKGSLGHLCSLKSEGNEAASSSERRARRAVANDKMVMIIAVAPETGITATDIGTAYAAAVTAVKTANSGDTDKTAILNDFPTTATFTVAGESFASSLFMSNLLLTICFCFKALL